MTAFADDLVLAYHSNSRINLISDVKFDISLFREWFSKHLLHISCKTKLMFPSFTQQGFTDVKTVNHSCCRFKHFNFNCGEGHNHSLNEDIQCAQDCFKIKISTEYKYLGIIMDAKLNWSSHINNLFRYLRSRLRALYYIKRVCSSHTRWLIYCGIVHTKLQ